MTKALRTKTPSELDNPKRWNQYLKPWFDVERFQDRINDRVGLNRDGRPIVRLVWGQDVTQHVYQEETPRYWTRRLRKLNDFVWWTVPRWMFERRIEPEQYVTAWNATRYSLKDPTTGGGHRCEDCGSSAEPKLLGDKVYCSNCAGTNVSGGSVIDKGPPPTDHYVYMMDASEHEGMTNEVDGWPACCARQFYTDRARCWGSYRHPADIDLIVIEKAVQAMNAAAYHDPYKPLTPQELFDAEQAANKQMERAQELMEAFERELQADILRTYPYPGFELGAGHFSDLGPSIQKGEESGNIHLTDK
jgi:hypothetical protein